VCGASVGGVIILGSSIARRAAAVFLPQNQTARTVESRRRLANSLLAPRSLDCVETRKRWRDAPRPQADTSAPPGRAKETVGVRGMFGSMRRSGLLAACRAARGTLAGARAPVAEAHARALARASSSSRAGARASAAPIWTARPFSSAADHAPPPAEIFGVVKVGAQQFKVVPDDLIVVEKLGEAKVNDPVVLSEVMMLGTAERTVIGRPSVPGAAVHAVVEEHFREAKKLAFKKKRRKGYQRLKGHRQVRRVSRRRKRAPPSPEKSRAVIFSPSSSRRASSRVSSTDRLTSLFLLTRIKRRNSRL
jgi:large subunit ribosomal protein L21